MHLPIDADMRHHLRHEVDHFSHLLASQGPITTFIHHNTLHGLQHLPFEEALAEAAGVHGASGYLPNEEYRRLYAAGRITDEDIEMSMEARPSLNGNAPVARVDGRTISAQEIQRTHLIHGIESLDPSLLRFEVTEQGAIRRLRADVPAQTRVAAVTRAREDLRSSFAKVGSGWTLADWMYVHTGVDVPAWLRAEVDVARRADHGADGRVVTHWLKQMAVPEQRWEGYLSAIATHLESGDVEDERAYELWLRAEANAINVLARRHFGVRGTFTSLAAHFGRDPEAYAVLSLWHACLAAFGLSDPLSPTDPTHLGVRDPGAAAEALNERFRRIELWGGPPIQVDPRLATDIHTVVERELEYLRTTAGKEPLPTDEPTTEDVPALEAAHLCWFVLHDLGATELNRRGLDALEALITLRSDEHGDEALLDELARRDPRREMLAFAQEALDDALNELGRTRSHSDFLAALTGEDITQRVNDYMIRRCAAFLDEGLSAWRAPGRVLGFYDSWRSLAERDQSFSLDDLAGWQTVLRHLPTLAEDAVIQFLHALDVDEKHWGDYLGRLLVALPGWAGMIAWRAARPFYPQQHVQPIDLIQYLAVRLFYETLLVQKLCDRTWRLDGSIESLRHYFHNHLAEFFVRRELHLGNLPEYLAQEARSLEERFTPGDDDPSEWERLADKIWLYRGSSGAQSDGVCRTAWRLFHVAQFLGLSGEDVRSLSEQQRDAIVGTLDTFPASDHGPVWLNAYEIHYRDQILNAIASNRGRGRWKQRDARPKAQVVFCIDEREEGIRRHFEALDPGHETLGAAGFFGVAMQFRGLDQHDTRPLCPPVIVPGHLIEEIPRPQEVERFNVHARRLKWNETLHNSYWEIKRNAVSAYFLLDFVGFLQTVPLFGRTLAHRLYDRAAEGTLRALVPPVRTALALEAAPRPERVGSGAIQLGFTTTEQADRVETLLRTMGLTHGFAPIVLLVAHGSSSLNNPHLSAYDCGACGGSHGGPNARAFAALVNREPVRAILRERGIDIPDDTWFVGSEHNTCSEAFTYYDVEDIPATHESRWRELVEAIDQARSRSAQERCRRFPASPKDASPERSLRHVEGRSANLSQSLPELGHATNAFAVVGRRSITQGLFLDRRGFLISYDATQDPEGAILERLLLAVGPVGAGINLEYYFSTVDNLIYGADTKVTHNVSGLIGVMEGATSDLRTGLPRQMIAVHEAMRLQLVVEATTAVLAEIYGRQQAIQELVGNAWVHLIAMDPYTGELSVFMPRGEFVVWDKPLTPLPVVRSSSEWYRGKTDFLSPALLSQDDRGASREPEH